MALYNSEAINGFPTGNLSLSLLNKIGPEHVQFVSKNSFSSRDLFFNICRRHLMILIERWMLCDKDITGVLHRFD